MNSNAAAHQSDLIVWPDGTHCYRDELHSMGHMGDDYRVIPMDTIAWDDFHDHQWEMQCLEAQAQHDLLVSMGVKA